MSPIARLEQLTFGIQLGDNKPSHMLTQLQRTGVTTDKRLIKDFWLQKLPVSARAVIAGVDKCNPNMSLEQQASIADEIIDVVRVSSVDVVSARDPNKHSQQNVNNNPIDQKSSIEERIKRIEHTLSRIELKANQDSNRRSRSRRRNNSTPRRSSSSYHGDCWYHKRFGDKAQKCDPPCNFSAEKN
ncbi:uncharacterized protein LOC118745440 [Rhagoletis pomonella]|uniref:uncharacterized protein LOC118745440 n=1 Tax=Rhagoletis pomonella TaxID=28610 RepID=UPI00177B4242|nr:uncharacterized protein LOC118745440 [Rhagoletis pomonella]